MLSPSLFLLLVRKSHFLLRDVPKMLNILHFPSSQNGPRRDKTCVRRLLQSKAQSNLHHGLAIVLAFSMQTVDSIDEMVGA